MYYFLDSISSKLPIVLSVVAVVLLVIVFWRRVPADKAMVITGLRKRVLVGRGGFMIPVLETACTISLEAVSMTTDIVDAPAKQGIFVNIIGTAVVKVDSAPEKVLIAVEQFCNGRIGDTTANIKSIVEQILEGKLRSIVSSLTVDQINEDRLTFEAKLEETIIEELGEMGLRLLSYTVLKINTPGGYLENRAIPQIAQSKSDADIASAERTRDTEIKTAAAVQAGKTAQLLSETEIAQANRDKILRTEAFRAEQDTARAEADIAYPMREIANKKRIAEENEQLAVAEAKVVEQQLVATVKKPADAEKYRVQVEAEANKERALLEAQARAEATLIEAKAKAEATRLQASADAEGIEARGKAEAQAIEAKGLAEATAKDAIGLAMQKFGEAAITEMVVNQLPDIMGAIADPMKQVDKITVIDNGGNAGAAKVGKIVSDVALNGFEVLKDITGVDIGSILNNLSKKNPVKPIIPTVDNIEKEPEAEPTQE